VSERDDPEDAPESEGPTWIAAAFATYGLALVVEWCVLDWREEFDDLAFALFSDHEPWVAPCVAVPCAVLGAAFTAFCSRRLPKVRALEQQLATRCSGTSDVAIAMLSVLCAVAEGLVARYWVFEWRGLVSSVSVAVGMALGPGVWVLWPVHLGVALLLGAVVHFGFGVAPSMLAHALILYWSLRRILAP
jgi:hypothetical protein